MTNSDFIPPLLSTGDQGALREALITRLPYTFTVTENPEAFVAVDIATGAIPWAVIWAGRVFYFDPDDNTSAHDALTVIVTADGYRYKTNGIAANVLSVKSRVVTAPPSTPAIGDAYLVPSGATGDWATHPQNVAVWTARGWTYLPPSIGRMVFVEDEAGFYHYGTAGAWLAGIGGSALGAGSVRVSSLIGTRTHWVVVNQTTNTPPVSPSNGVAYIVGPSPTGAWSGHTGQIAVWEISAWAFYIPQKGWNAYDQALNTIYIFNGAWNQQASGYNSVRIISATGTVTPSGSGSGAGTAPSYATAPTSSGPRVEDPIGSPINIQADYAGQQFEVTYIQSVASIAATITGAGGISTGFAGAVGLFVDSETQARDWYMIGNSSTTGVNLPSIFTPFIEYTFVFSLADTSIHQLRFMLCIGRTSGSGTVTAVTGTFTRRRVIIRRIA